MKKFYLFILVGLCTAGSSWACPGLDNITGYKYGGYCSRDGRGSEVCFTIDENYTLAFWYGHPIYDQGGQHEGVEYSMPDFVVPTASGEPIMTDDCPAPWSSIADQIRAVDLSHLHNIGKNAFYGMTQLRYVIIPEEIDTIGEHAFLGCVNLTTLEMRRASPPVIYSTSLQTGTDEQDQIRNIIVMRNDAKKKYEEDDLWHHYDRIFTISNGIAGEHGEIFWAVGQSDTLQSLKLNIARASGDDPIVLADRKDGETFPFDAIGEFVEDLVLDDYISYIGKGVFSPMENVQTIQFHHHSHPLDSIHIDAFASNITPWKFAIGDPQDGAVRPPKVIGYNPTNADNPDPWRNFREKTVLYLPDSLLADGNRCIDLYRNDPLWGKSFKRITDRTVDTLVIDNKVRLDWLPLENATAYRLTITMLNCNSQCDTTIIIPATGLQGLVDWANVINIPTYDLGITAPHDLAARRAPMGNDGGGLTLTISIKTDSGDAHDKDVEMQVEGMKPDEEYSFVREVLKNAGKPDDALAKGGSFKLIDKTTGMETVAESGSQTPRVYDILGRCVGSSTDNLPTGIYILDNGTTRTKIMMR